LTILVSNAGTHPELAWAAAALSNAGIDFRYFTSLSFGRDHKARRIIDKSPLRDYYRRRLLPLGLSDQDVQRLSASAELAHQVSLWIAPGAAPTALRLRNTCFDEWLALRLNKHANETSAVVAQATSSVRLLRAARQASIPSLLSCPIAHHAWSMACLEREASRNPRWRRTLQWPANSDRRNAELEEEIRLAHRVIVLSSFAEQTFIDSGVPASKLQVIPLGVDIGAFPPRFAEPSKNEPFRVLFVGQLTQRKGVSYLIDAFKNARLGRSPELMFVGTPVGNSVQLLEEAGAVVLPHVSRHQLPQIYRRAHVFVLPSLIEGFAQTPLEAMASGVPTVVSTNTGTCDIIDSGRDGYVFAVGDTQRLSELLEALYHNPHHRRAMGQAGAQTARRNTWDKYQTLFMASLLRFLPRAGGG
jgi:starch synthase